MQTMDEEFPGYPEDLFVDIEEKFSDSMNDIEENFERSDNILFTGIPKITPEKEDRFKKLILKIFNTFLNENNLNDISYVDIFINFDCSSFQDTMIIAFDKRISDLILQSFNGYVLDKNHTFYCCLFSDLESILRTSDTFLLPEKKDHIMKLNTRKWLSDKYLRDQFILQMGKNVRINWNVKPGIKNSGIETYYEKNKIIDHDTISVIWSNHGSYLVSFHKPGFLLWGSEPIVKMFRFVLTDCQHVKFSPNEKFVIAATSSQRTSSKHSMYNKAVGDLITCSPIKNCTIFEIASEKQLFTLVTNKIEWQSDSSKIYYQSSDAIKTITTAVPHIKNNFVIPGLMGFSLSPNNILCYLANQNNGKMMVTLLDTNSVKNTYLKTKTFTYTENYRFMWNKSGNLLTVQLDNKSSTINIFKLDVDGIPMETMDYNNLVECVFNPDLSDSHIAIIDNKTITIHKITDSKIERVKLIINKPNAKFYWSMNGFFNVVTNHMIEFHHITTHPFVSVIADHEFYEIKDVQWDPSYRYVAVIVITDSREIGYCIYNLMGEILYREIVPDLTFFKWRPRSEKVLSKKKMQDITNKLDKYSKEFKIQDKQESNKASAAVIAYRKALMDEWTSTLSYLLDYDIVIDHNKLQESYFNIGNETHVIEYEVEEIISTVRTRIN